MPKWCKKTFVQIKKEPKWAELLPSTKAFVHFFAVNKNLRRMPFFPRDSSHVCCSTPSFLDGESCRKLKAVINAWLHPLFGMTIWNCHQDPTRFKHLVSQVCVQLLQSQLAPQPGLSCTWQHRQNVFCVSDRRKLALCFYLLIPGPAGVRGMVTVIHSVLGRQWVVFRSIKLSLILMSTCN